jgi:hypothetical protein
VAGFEQHAVAEVVVGDVGDRRTGAGSLPVGVEDERVVCAVEDASGLGCATVSSSETVGVVVAAEKGILNGVECVLGTGRVVDSPKLLVSGVQRERADAGVGIVREGVRHPVTPRLVFEGKDEFAHTHA